MITRRIFEALVPLLLVSSSIPLTAWQNSPPQTDHDGPQLTDLYGDPLPEGAIARLGTTAYRHHSLVSGVGFLADNKTVLLCNNEGSLLWIDADTGALIRENKRPLADLYLNDFVIAVDRSVVAVRGFSPSRSGLGAIALLDSATGEPHFRMDPPSNRVIDIALSPDNRLLAIAEDQRIQVFDTETKAVVATHDPEKYERKVAFSSNSKELVYVTNSSVCFWDWALSKELRTFPLRGKWKKDWARELEPSPVNNAHAAIVFGGRIGIGLFDRDQATFATLKSSERDYWHASDIEFFADGKKLVSQRDTNDRHTMNIWNLETASVEQEIPISFEGYTHISISPDGSKIAAISESFYTFDVVDVATGQLISHRRPGSQGPVRQLSFLGMGRQIATAGDEGRIRIWETESGRLIKTLVNPELDGRRSHGRWIRALASSPDGKQVASSSLDDTVCVWDVESGNLIYRLGGHGPGGYRALAFSEDGNQLVSWGDDMRVFKWDLSNGRALKEDFIGSHFGMPEQTVSRLPRASGFGSMVTVDLAAFSPAGEAFLLSAGGITRLFDVATGEPRAETPIDLPRFSRSIGLSAGAKLCLTSETGRIVTPRSSRRADRHPVQLRNLKTGESIAHFDLPGKSGPTVAITTAGDRFAAGIWQADGSMIKVYRSPSGDEIASFRTTLGYPVALEFSPDGSLLASGMNNGNVLIWKLP